MINSSVILVLLLCIMIVVIITNKYVSVKTEDVLRRKWKALIHMVCYAILIACTIICVLLFTGPRREVSQLVQPCDVMGLKDEDEFLTVVTMKGNYQFSKKDTIIDIHHIDDPQGEGILIENKEVNILGSWIKDNFYRMKVTVYIDDNKK